MFYDVLFDVPNPDGQLTIQVTAQVCIVLAQAKGALLIPAVTVGNALQGSQIKVQVLKPDGSIELRPIKIGIKGEISFDRNRIWLSAGPKSRTTRPHRSAGSGLEDSIPGDFGSSNARWVISPSDPAVEV